MNSATTVVEPLGGESLFHGYRPPGDAYDEMCAADGVLRPAWRQFAPLIDALGPRELERRWQQASRLIHEDGLTFNVHGDEDRERRWELDALPVMVAAAEWSGLSAGLAQRAALLNALLADLYGPQHVLHEGLLPAELVFAHPNFLRPCHGWKVPHGRYLHFYAADLVRSPGGRWCVVADHAQTPVGSGYAVENRIVISRMIPHTFHDCRVQRLAGFFMTLRDTLRSLASQYRANPHIVLLSPGPASATYFEDAYLARYLGYTLVEGEDLTVRDNRVFMKTLGGLVGVDAILRRVRDRDCDPLELDSQSRFGVPGLNHAARCGNVALANALGSGVLEAPALMPFLPALARRLMGEDLLLPSVASWWCGEAESLKYVLDRLDSLLIRTALSDPPVRPLHGGSLGKAARQQLAEAIRAHPARYVAQELIARSTTPVWDGGQLRAGPIALRTFSVLAGEGYQVLPGALAQVSAPAKTAAETMFAAQGSKDVWVLADGPVAPVSLLSPPGSPVMPRRTGNDLPSRVADNLFWLGRHVERAEGTSRLLRSIATRLISESPLGGPSELQVLFRALTWEGRFAPEAHPTDERDVTELEVVAFLYSHEHPGGLPAILTDLRRVASIVRDRISLESWRILNRMDEDFHPGYPLGVVSLADVLAMLNRMLLNLSAFGGVAMENMTRGPGWQFLDLGRRLERALHVISLLRSTLFMQAANEHAVMDALLEIADSSMTYRNRYATNLQMAPLVDLLLTDETNPRSLGFQLAALAGHVEHLPRGQSDSLLTDEQRLLLALVSSVRLANVEALSELAPDGTRPQLEELLVNSARQLRELSNAISHKYLVHGGPPRQMAEIHPG